MDSKRTEFEEMICRDMKRLQDRITRVKERVEKMEGSLESTLNRLEGLAESCLKADRALRAYTKAVKDILLEHIEECDG